MTACCRPGEGCRSPRLRDRAQTWLDNTGFHHRWMANGPLWWACPVCRRMRRTELDDLWGKVRELELRLEAGVPRSGRCGGHPPELDYLPSACTSLAYACELDAGHAGMHRDGSMEWSQ